MKNNFKYLTLLFILSTLTIFSCCKSDDCKDVACTKEFRSISVQINQVSMPPVFHPISIKVYKPNGKFWKEVTDNFNLRFVILDDADMEVIEKSGTYKVDVIKNNTIIATEMFKLGKDCCHVLKFEGIAEIDI